MTVGCSPAIKALPKTGIQANRLEVFSRKIGHVWANLMVLPFVAELRALLREPNNRHLSDGWHSTAARGTRFVPKDTTIEEESFRASFQGKTKDKRVAENPRCFDLPTDHQAEEVLRAYLLPGVPKLTGLGNRGGFSGAGIWRVESEQGDYCLRRWPAQEPGSNRLRLIHQAQTRAADAGLTFIPRLARTRFGQTWFVHAGRYWELSSWMPGCADFWQRPSVPRIEAACAALARTHLVWSKHSFDVGPCPAIQRRLQVARSFRLPQSVPSDFFRQVSGKGVDPRFGEQLWQRAVAVVNCHLPSVEPMLAPWAERIFPLQFCFCDIWHDHVLFTDDKVTGIVDFGAVKLDHVAVDLARLLGSMAGDDVFLRQAGIRAYQELRYLTSEELCLVDLLDRTGTIAACANWLHWLASGERSFADTTAVAQRLEQIVRRIESW
ncbi:MAG: hypothetical protein KatS3mg105_2118 [Gemmatales bacterium]|nr:MAG: hypothetical protein KatS3mg105_2118 [Gemmatales bacterium]